MKKTIITFLLFISTASYSQSDESNSLIKRDIEALCKGEFLNFHKAHTYFFEGQTDSSFFYSSQVYNKLPKNSNIKYYLDYVYGVNAYDKGFFSIAEKKLYSIPDTFPYKYLVDYNLGNIFLYKDEYLTALNYYNSVIKSDKIFNSQRLKRIYHNVGVCYLFLKKHKISEEFFLKELEISKNDKDTISIIYSKMDLGNLFYEQYKDDIAISYFKEAYQLASLFNNLDAKQTTAKNLAIVEKNRKRYKESVDYLLDAEKWKDSIWNRDRISELLEKDKQQAIALKEDEIQLEKAERQVQRKQLNWSLGGAIIILIISFLVFYIYIITLKQKKQLEKINHLKDFLFSVVSHDLRSPINLVKAMNEDLMIALEQGNLEFALQSAQKNQNILENTIHLLNNVLNWALKENDQLFYYPKEHLLDELLKGWLFDFKDIAENKGITISTTLNEQSFVFIDKELMKIVFRNLIDNAIKYVPNKGIINIKIEQKEPYCELIISDNGLGISPEVLKIIEKSPDLSIEKVNRSKGVGLGLILCKHIVKMNKGVLNFRNNNNKQGLTITIKLPTTKN